MQFKDASVANLAVIANSEIANNQLLPSEKHDMMGGGVHVEFSTVSATFQTDNNVAFTEDVIISLNTAGLGIGGGMSMLYKHPCYHGNSGDSVSVDNVALFYNLAASGSACAFQSLPTHGKRLFRGVRITSIIAYLNASESEDMSFSEEPRVRNLTYSSQRSLEYMIQQFSQGISILLFKWRPTQTCYF